MSAQSSEERQLTERFKRHLKGISVPPSGGSGSTDEVIVVKARPRPERDSDTRPRRFMPPQRTEDNENDDDSDDE
jgi:hypothetical protein